MASDIARAGAVLVGAAAILAAAPLPARGQVTPYSVTHSMGTYSGLPSGTDHTPVAYGTLPAWDEGAARITLPFAFDFFGTSRTEIWAYTNGFLAFQPPPSGLTILSAPTVVPRAGDAIDGYIAVMWQDLDRDRTTMPLPPPPRIRSAVNGAVGSRTFTIEYAGFKRARATQSDANFKVVLFEGTNRIQVVYGPTFGILNATAAVEASGGVDGFNLHRASATCTGLCPCGAASCGMPNFPSGLEVQLDLPPAPELVGDIVGPPGAAPGASFEARTAVRNAGLVAAGGFDYEVLLSASNTSTAGARRLGRFSVAGGLAPLTSETATRTYTVPASTPVSTQYLAVVVDSEGDVVEAIETNNVVFSEPFRTGQELQGTLNVPMITGPGETLTLDLDVRNAGAPDTRSFDVRFYLSDDGVLDAQDTLLDTVSLSLPDGFRRSGPVDLPVPLTTPLSPPLYRVLAVLDSGGAIAEIDENNNLVVSTTEIRVRGPELEVAAVRSATVAVRGRPFPVEVDVRNAGGGIARGLRVCLLLGQTANLDPIVDRRLAETDPFDLLSGQTLTVRLEPVISPLASSLNRFLGAGVDCDNVVIEGVETNNLLVSGDTLNIRDPAPDYRVEAVQTPVRLVAGERVTAVVTLSNRGTAEGRAELALLLSRDAALSAADTELVRVRTAPLAAAGVADIVLSAEVPADAPSGNVFLGVVADPDDATMEVNEFDNEGVEGPLSLAGTSMAIVGVDPAPAIIDRPYRWRFAAEGGLPTRTWQIDWESGAAPAGLSFDPATGELSGTPLAASEGRNGYRLTVRAGTETAQRSGALLIVPAGLPLEVVTRRLPPARRNEAYDEPLVAVGGEPPYTWRLGGDLERLPVGLGLSADGRVSGEPALRGAYAVRVEVQDRFGRSARAPVAIDVVDAVAGVEVTTAAVPSGLVELAYQTRLTVSGVSDEPGTRLTWSLEGGAPGLSLDPDSGAYSGSPTEAGLFPMIVTVEERPSMLFDTAAYIIEIVERGTLVIGGESSLPEATLGMPYRDSAGQAVRLVGSPDEGDLRWALIDGKLPPGLSMDGDGAITGTPTEVGRFAFVPQVRNGAQELRRTTKVIEVVDPSQPPPTAGGTDDGGCRCGAPTPASSAQWTPLLLIGLVLIARRRRASPK